MSITAESIERMNRWSKSVYSSMVRRLDEYEKDSLKEGRLKTLECKSCFYLKGDSACFQAFTEYSCGNCHESKKHHNSHTPRYCELCSEVHDVCRRCGANV